MRARVMTVFASLLGCITYDDVPLATAHIEGVMPCVGCRSPEAVYVTLAGYDALPHAVIVVYDTRVMHDLGQRPAAIMRADALGEWKVTLRALRVPGRLELPVLPGDVLEVFQKDGDGDASEPYRITVPAPERRTPAVPPIVEEQHPQAADPAPIPAGG